ncbi:MAG: carboxypeptidase-like regulatory domain-containing protein [Terriglobia bacterium]
MRRKNARWLLLLIAALSVAAVWVSAASRKSAPLTSITVLVTDAVSNKPVFQARLTLQFRDPSSRRGKTLSYSAKTDTKGKYRFSFIPMENVYLIVTAPDHQTFGKQFAITQDGQVLSVKLHRPQPLR